MIVKKNNVKKRDLTLHVKSTRPLPIDVCTEIINSGAKIRLCRSESVTRAHAPPIRHKQVSITSILNIYQAIINNDVLAFCLVACSERYNSDSGVYSEIQIYRLTNCHQTYRDRIAKIKI